MKIKHCSKCGRQVVGREGCSHCNKVNAYKAVIVADPGHLLLGGVHRTSSTPFELEADAEDFKNTSVRINQSANRQCTGYVVGCECDNPIMHQDIIDATSIC